MRIFSILLLLSPLVAFSQTKSLSQREACTKFSDAVVQINAGGQSYGSGFIVSPDGYILTANHVVRNEQGQYYSAIFVTLSGGRLVSADPILPLNPEIVGKDYAIIKIPSQPSPLPFLELGSNEEVATGGDATIIGFPFSAVSPEGRNVSTKFCLSGTFAASDSISIPIDGAQTTPRGTIPLHQDVQVDVIYFQAPSVKGISGSPIISRDTGQVVGIVSTKLTGIGNSLAEMRDRAIQAQNSGGRVSIMGIDPTKFTIETVNVLDSQLANGLGSAVGIDDPKEALKRAQRKRH